MVRRNAAGGRLLTRNGIDWSSRFPLIVQAVGALKVRSCLIDGEAIAYDNNALASFELLRGRRHDRVVALCAFDLLGRDLRRTPLEERKRALARLIRKPRPGIMLNATFEEAGDIVFKHACGAAKKALGAQFEASIDGTPRTYRERKAFAIEAAEYLKHKHPNSVIVVKDLQSGEATTIKYKPDLGPR